MVGVVGSSPIAPTNFCSTSGQPPGLLNGAFTGFPGVLIVPCGDAEKDHGHVVVLPWPFCKSIPNSLTRDPMNTQRSTFVDRAHADMRIAMLLRQAPIEFARAVYGINDRASGRIDTMAAREVARAQRQGVSVTEERAEQRARGYLPTLGQEHCPRCWVVYGHKCPLRFRDATEERPETAACHACGAEYATSRD